MSHNLASPEQAIQPIRADYAHRPILEGFDWPSILSNLTRQYRLSRRRQLYLVVFRSQRAPGADAQVLRAHDERAHEEAKRSPALLYYFGGDPDLEGYCVSFCLWTSAEEARAATRHEPHHRAAVELADQMYSSFRLERYDIQQGDSGVIIDPQ